MPETFGDVVRAVRQHVTLAPPLLCRQWVKEAWQELMRSRIEWSFLRAESEFLINVSKGGTCNVTRGSASVSGGTLVYASSDVNRQFRTGSGTPIYTIVAASATSYTLDRVFGGSTATPTATVFDAYVTAPSDWASYIAVLDVSNGWQLNIWMTADEVNYVDPQRSYTGTPWAVAGRRYVTAGSPSLVGRVQHELYPYQLAEKNYPFYYFKRFPELTEDLLLPGPVQDRSDVLIHLALSRAAAWPGTADIKNPYYNSGLAAAEYSKFKEAAARLEVIDEEIYMTWLETVNVRRIPFAPVDSAYAQVHDIDSAPLALGWLS